MGTKYVVVLVAGKGLPERNSLVYQAWGEVPVSYFQDHESLNESSFLDLKVNKWEVNAEWSRKSEDEPWIRIEILRGGVVAEYLATQGLSLLAGVGEALLSIEMDDGGGEIDEILLAHLVSVFMPGNRVFRWRDELSEIDGEYISRFPAREAVLEQLRRC
ncbi:hypothetical protein [Stenotrophomonas maltophilia]|uniref:hypothetical protein n=1 Tax=Stenotrophomonas maltophilia TaxID=40324 RepID=UPI0034DB779B